ncbi:MAG: type II toxin-antitoxin system RelE/ParE family toxin [Patescibacteria group bacterium]
MDWKIAVAKPAQKQVAKFSAKDQDRIGAAVLAMGDDPFSGDIVKLEGEGDRWRRRVGNYRIFFRIDSTTRTVDVTTIVRRTSSTY